MNRKEYSSIVKTFALSVLCVLPLVIILDLLIYQSVSMAVLVIIDVIIFIVVAFAGFLINENRQKRIKEKREAIKAKKTK